MQRGNYEVKTFVASECAVSDANATKKNSLTTELRSAPKPVEAPSDRWTEGCPLHGREKGTKWMQGDRKWQ